jgi:hypothetical protein
MHNLFASEVAERHSHQQKLLQLHRQLLISNSSNSRTVEGELSSTPAVLCMLQTFKQQQQQQQQEPFLRAYQDELLRVQRCAL